MVASLVGGTIVAWKVQLFVVSIALAQKRGDPFPPFSCFSPRLAGNLKGDKVSLTIKCSALSSVIVRRGIIESGRGRGTARERERESQRPDKSSPLKTAV